jgi:hypothetical protein
MDGDTDPGAVASSLGVRRAFPRLYRTPTWPSVTWMETVIWT